ncbi:MAG: alpha/beta fold hydrolase [Bacteroidota bacterium]
MIHGLAASHHDWDNLIPEVVQQGYSAHALDLMGHGESAKPASRSYQMQWVFDHFSAWVDSLGFDRPPVLVGHSLGGYLALEYARRFPSRTRALVLVSPFYRLGQLPAFLRLSYRRPALSAAVVGWTPEWLFRILVDATSLSMGHSSGGVHHLSPEIRAQTALDFKRTASGVYNLPNVLPDLTRDLPQIRQPTAVIWGARDNTLAPASFEDLAAALPNVLVRKSLDSGHVPHQSHPEEFSALVLEFLKRL